MSENLSPHSYRTALADLVKAIEDGMGSLDMWDPAYKAAKVALELPLDGPGMRSQILEEAAEECLKLWRTAPNVRPDYTQTKISHGCIASARAIRDLMTDGSDATPMPSKEQA